MVQIQLNFVSDLFGMGSTMYEFLTGRRPFGSTGKDTRARIISQPAPPMAEVRDDVPPFVEEIVNKAMAKRRE